MYASVRLWSNVRNTQKGWLAIAKLKPLVEREFLSTNEKAWFPTVNNKLPLHYFLCVMYLKPMMSAALVKCNEESNQLEGPKVIQWLKTFPKSVLLTINVMWTMKCLQNLMCSPRCELAVIAGPGENSVEKGGEGRRLTEIGGVGQRSESLTMEANIFRVGG